MEKLHVNERERYVYNKKWRQIEHEREYGFSKNNEDNIKIIDFKERTKNTLNKI